LVGAHGSLGTHPQGQEFFGSFFQKRTASSSVDNNSGERMQNELQQLRQRLECLEAIEAIRRLKHRYLRACDRQRPDDVRACFVPNGAVIAYEGFPEFADREDFVRIYAQMGCRPQIVDMHHGQNPDISLTGENRAAGLWDIYYFGIDLTSRTATQLAGEYQDQYERVDGSWLIRSTRFRRTSVLSYSVSADGALQCTEMGRGNPAPAPA